MSIATAAAERSLLELLDATVREPRAAAKLAAVADEVARDLARDPTARLAWQPIPLETYTGLPKEIASSWIFVLRANCTSGAERHPNSIQQFMSLRGSADMQTWNGTRWVSNVLSAESRVADADKLAGRWLSIPANTWLRPVMGAGDWTVVSFHTASDEELIEERPADDENPDRGAVSLELYAGRKAR